jgi:ubiquinone/menaquinone biosynthesis C-methylase UbiE
MSNLLPAPFGVEYAFRPAWKYWERLYIRIFGLVDLPTRLRARVVLHESLALRPRKVLDLGSGTGNYSFFLSRKENLKVTGLEIDSNRIADSNYIAQRLGRENVQFLLTHGDTGLEGFPPESFDLALAVEVLPYLPDLPLALKKIHRLLVPGGYLIGHFPVLGFLRPQEKMLLDDEKIQRFLTDTKFQVIHITPTFGGMIRRLSRIYKGISQHPLLVAVLFPLLLLSSAPFQIKAQSGDYRLFVARKPGGDDSPKPT